MGEKYLIFNLDLDVDSRVRVGVMGLEEKYHSYTVVRKPGLDNGVPRV